MFLFINVWNCIKPLSGFTVLKEILKVYAAFFAKPKKWQCSASLQFETRDIHSVLCKGAQWCSG